MITRRLLLSAASLLPFVPAFTPVSARANETSVVTAALRESSLVYLTPLKSDGSESSCQAEIWFVQHDNEVYVVTGSNDIRSTVVSQATIAAACSFMIVAMVPKQGGVRGVAPARRSTSSAKSQGRPRQPRPTITPAQPVSAIIRAASSASNGSTT